MEAATFTCSICGDASRDICVFCTKDACSNHICQRCHRCSDCCACEMPLTSSTEPSSTEAISTEERRAPEAAVEPLSTLQESTELLTPAS